MDGQWVQGDLYERYMGRWSRPVAAAFVSWLGLPPGGRWLDVGCGTGALSAAVLAAAEPDAVVGVDFSAGFVAAARLAVPDPRAGFEVADARSLPFDDGAFDAVVSGVALNFVPDTASAVAELARVAAPGGTVAAYVWDYAEGMSMLRHFWDAAAALDPAAATLDEGARFPLCRPDALGEAWKAAGFSAVATGALTVPTTFADFGDYWTPFLGGQGPAPGYVATLPEQHRDALRESLRRDLPAGPDGSIPLTARAWAVRGTR